MADIQMTAKYFKPANTPPATQTTNDDATMIASRFIFIIMSFDFIKSSNIEPPRFL